MRRKLALGCAGLLGLLVVLFLALYGIGLALDSEIRLETAADLDATPEQIFPVLSTFPGVKAWWEGAARGAGGPPLEVVHLGGPASGPGMEVGFSSGGEVFERWTVLDSQPPGRIDYEIDFKIFKVKRTILLTDRGDGSTRASWTERGTIDSPLMRYMALLPQDDTIARFQDALGALEEAAAGAGGPARTRPAQDLRGGRGGR